jgi:hypothetical protein
MKRLLIAGAVFAVFAGFGRADEEKFSRSVTPEDFLGAGLNQLTPAQLSRLDALITAYKNGELASAQRSAAEALAAKQAAEAEVRTARAEAAAAKQAAEAKTRAAEAQTKEAKAEVVEIRKTSLGFFSKAKIMLMPGTKVEYAVIKSTIPGKFQGWEGRATFLLANGQYWQVANGGSTYYTPTKEDIEVEITQSSIGGYWMRFPTLDTEVRVKLLSDR